jgi:hypothetical protein
MKLFERSSKDSAILRRDFQKKASSGRGASMAQHDTRAGGVADDEVMLMNQAHDVIPLSRSSTSSARRLKSDDAARSVLKITGKLTV